MRRILFALIVAAACLWPAPVAAQMVVHTVSVTTDGSGDATVYTPQTFGHVVAIRYVPGNATPDSTVDITVTDNGTDLQVLAATNLGGGPRDFWPRAFTMTTTGTVALYAGGGTNVLDLVPVAGAIKVVVAQGGASKTATLYIYVQGR